MAELILMTDGSVNAQSQIGYGAYLALTDINQPLDSLKAQVKVKRFAQTSSTKLELQTLLWALSEEQLTGQKLSIYTDSQNIIGLPGRREKLERNDYCSKDKRRLNNDQLYQQFYRMTERLDCDFIKVRGHQPAGQKNTIEQVFTLIDRAARQALRADC